MQKNSEKPTNAKTKILTEWILINGLIPICVGKLIELDLFPIPANISLAVIAVLTILLCNIILAKKHRNYSGLFYATISLNLIVFILIGAISIIDAIFQLPFLIEIIKIYTSKL